METDKTNTTSEPESAEAVAEVVVREKHPVGRMALVATLSLVIMAALFIITLQLLQDKMLTDSATTEAPVVVEEQVPAKKVPPPTYEERLAALEALSEGEGTTSQPIITTAEREAALESLSEQTFPLTGDKGTTVEERQAALSNQ